MKYARTPGDSHVKLERRHPLPLRHRKLIERGANFKRKFSRSILDHPIVRTFDFPIYAAGIVLKFSWTVARATVGTRTEFFSRERKPR